MATPTWPTFPCEREPEVEVIGGKTLTFRSEGGATCTRSLSTASKFRFTFSYRGLRTSHAAPAPYADRSEVAAAVYLVQELKGAAGLVYVVNPLDGQPVLCRLEADSVVFKKVPKCSWYQGTVSFVSE